VEGSEVRVRDDDLPYSYAAVAFEGVAAIHPDFFVVQVANQMMSSWNQAVTGGKFLSSPLARIMAKFVIILMKNNNYKEIFKGTSCAELQKLFGKL
jgi:hypothetical protein